MLRPFARLDDAVSRPCLWMALALIGLGLFVAVPAGAQDQVGVYWDADYTTIIGATPTVPGVTTGYVVLHDATGGGGVLGWEACFTLEGPGAFVGWDFQGQGINAGTGNCIAVGYVSPLPPSAAILLATFELAATDTGPIRIGMRPDYNASLPGAMSYIPGDDPGALRAMTTTTGLEAVAGLNGGNPLVTLSSESLDFGTVAFGATATRTVSITNDSDDAFPLDLSITALCDYFTLPGTPPTEVPAHATVALEVAFSPVQERAVICHLTLSPNLPTVALTGAGAAPVPGWEIIGSRSFGYVNVGESALRDVTLRNTGQTVLQLDPAFIASCPAFTLLAGGGPRDMAPTEEVVFQVQFAPTVAGYQFCFLDTGAPEIPQIRFDGLGRNPETSWSAPAELDFLVRFVGIPASAPLTIINTGDTVIPLHASLPADCDAFTITQGGGYDVSLQPGQSHAVMIQFLADQPGHFECLLDLGSVITPIPLRGDAVAGPGSLTVLPTQLVFPSILAGQSAELVVVVRNAALFDVTFAAAIDPTSTAFLVVSGAGTTTLVPGESRQVRVRFTPPTAGEFQGLLRLGDGHPTVPLSGSGYEGTAACRLEPAGLNFGSLILGGFADLAVTVHNDGSTSLLLEPTTTDPAFFIDAPPVLLAPGGQHSFTVRFHPTSLGVRTGSLLLGDNACNAVSLAGSALIGPDAFLAEPDTVVIPAVPVGTIVDRDIVITSRAEFPLDLNVQIVAPSYGFILLQGGGPGVLYPFESRLVRLRFQCLTEQTYATHISFGPGLPLVPVFAEGVVIRPDCELASAVVNFGTTAVDHTRNRSVAVTNNSDQDLVLAPTSDEPAFTVSASPAVLPPGGTASLTIVFRPESIGAYAGTIDLGNDLCNDIAVFGEGSPATQPWSDLIGIYWDENYDDNSIYSNQPNQVLTGYLVLSSASTAGGVSGWECRVETEGSAVIMGWTLAGQAIDVGQSPDFVVGLATPLPYTDHALLASFECLAPAPWDATLFSLHPTRVPSVPGQMSWVPGDGSGNLLAMRTVTGIPLVADINGGSPVGLQVPTPQALVLGGQIDLSWPTPTGLWDGCHVYRRLDGQSAQRLTGAPITGTGAQLVFTDLTAGLAPGATLHYSYAVVRAGQESGRSAEVTVTLPELAPAATRLLPNVPNPFNPLTEIRYQVAASQHVDLRIYDVTGRLVRTLVAGNVAAGPQATVWQGRDDTGRTVPSGTYYVRLVTREGIDSRKILLLK